MNKISSGVIALAMLMSLSVGAHAEGCLKGAAVGGVAGHLAHHAVAGAIAGCAVGHHMAAKAKKEKAAAAATQK
ncbi:hypothetical protein GW590_08645 [Rahnella sp. SAP-1]|uniref:Glycine zipper 2TM domain n=1 Tax=Rouxiella aceris TaxID=2703884 RepID=A0A848MIZ5_9GAMM|nr:hypothetical protein [Rouxiella aceris]NMP26932.1 hypothetical protein [Rouxiella aceris]